VAEAVIARHVGVVEDMCESGDMPSTETRLCANDNESGSSNSASVADSHALTRGK